MRPMIGAGAKRLVLAALICAMLSGAAMPALADSLTDKLCEKGVLSEAECNELRQADGARMSSSFKDGFKWKSNDGQHEIQLAGRVQLDYRSYDNQTPADTFDIRRAFLGVKGKIYENWSFEVTSNLDGSDLEYAYLDYKWSDAAQLRMGAFKYQFSFDQLTSSRFTDFVERSFVDSWVPGKDVGVMFYGEPRKNVVSYSLGVANGEGKNSNEVSAVADDKDIIGRAAVNFAPMANFENGVLHLGAGFATGTIAAGNPGNQRTEARGLTFFRGVAPGGTEMDRERTNIEGVVAFGSFKVQGEYQTANFSGIGGYDRDIDTSYISANWLITGEKYIDNYTIDGMRSIKPNNTIENGGRGAWEVGVRFSQFEADDQFAIAANSTNKADAVTIGVKWIPNNVTRFMLDYVTTDFDTPITAGVSETVDSEKAVILRSQIYF